MAALLELTEAGFYCPRGDFFLDPWRPVDRAIITHAHRDRLQPGCGSYLCAREGVGLMRMQLGAEAVIEERDYGEPVDLHGVRVSLHPAGHLLGSAQVRLEHAGDVWVFAGDYHPTPGLDGLDFEPLPCRVLIGEATFGLPVFRWPTRLELAAEIDDWWKLNQERGRTSVLYVDPFGRAQKVLAGLDASLGEILVHDAIDRVCNLYREQHHTFPPSEPWSEARARATRGRSLVLAPPWAASRAWLRPLGLVATAMASGWMQLRGTRRRYAVDRGFAVSDHADWPALLRCIEASGAEEVWLTHGYSALMARYLNEQGLAARAVASPYEGEIDQKPGQPVTPVAAE